MTPEFLKSLNELARRIGLGSSVITSPAEPSGRLLVQIGNEPPHERLWMQNGKLYELRLKRLRRDWVLALEVCV